MHLFHGVYYSFINHTSKHFGIDESYIYRFGFEYEPELKSFKYETWSKQWATDYAIRYTALGHEDSAAWWKSFNFDNEPMPWLNVHINDIFEIYYINLGTLNNNC